MKNLQKNLNLKTFEFLEGSEYCNDYYILFSTKQQAEGKLYLSHCFETCLVDVWELGGKILELG